MSKTINCSIPPPGGKGYDPEGRKDPSKSDLRVSGDFNMETLPDKIKIVCEGHTNIKFRIRENNGSSDRDAYNGRYFKDGDIISRTDYDKLYISDPRYIQDPYWEPPHEFSVKFEDYRKIRFLVSSDFHLCGGQNGKKEIEKHQADTINLNTLVKQVARLGVLDFYAVCGDLSWDSNSADEKMFENDFLNRIIKETSVKCVCEGWGNHDVRIKGGNLTNIKDGIRDRNEKYRKSHFGSSYSMSESALVIEKKYDHYHYHWYYDLWKDGKKLHFFMLNNAPGSDYKLYKNGAYNPDDYMTEQDERNSYGSLKFLEKEINRFTPNDYYVLFFHINFNADTDRWWHKSQKDLIDVISKGGGKYVTSFFGHTHSSAGIEVLTDDIKGYRCACKDKHGAAHYMLAEMGLDGKGNLEYSLKSYSNDGTLERDFGDTISV